MGNLYEGSYRRVNFKSAIAQIAAVIIFALCSLLPNKSFATHAAGSDLTYKWISGNTYQVTVTFYRDCAGVSAPTSVTLDAISNSCLQVLNVTLNKVSGTGQEITFPCNPSTTLCNGGSGPGIQQYVYRGNITLPAQCTDWVLSYHICCRNCAITTIVHPSPCTSSDLTPELYVEATLNNTTAADGTGKGVNSPVFSNIPEAYLCANQAFTYNEGVVDPDGDSLSYQFIAPKTSATSNVTFVSPFTATNWITSSPAVSINSKTGDITMTPTNINEVAVCAVLITAYRHGVKVGSVIRDMQFRVNNCSPNLLPTATGINGTNVFAATICPGSSLSFFVNSNDGNAGDSVKMSWDTGIVKASFAVTSGVRHPTGTFSWTPGAADARSQPYQFTVTVRDNACPNNGFQIYSFTITVPVHTISFTGVTNVTCNGGNNGAVTANASGGDSPYTYAWNTSSTSQTITGLTAATYTVTITDADGCTGDSSIAITQPAAIVLTPSTVASTCFGGSNGSASVVASGGVTPYTYKWSPGGATTAGVSGLTGGTTYTVTVTDAHSCNSTASVAIPSPPQLTATVSSSTDETCNGQATGSIDLTVSGGTPGYTYLWSGGEGTTQDISNLPAATYTVTVTDTHGCSVTQSQTITEPGAVHPLITSTTVNGVNVACFGDTTGSASVTVTGGFPTFTYLWSTGATTQSISGLKAEIVTVTVTDANGCQGISPAFDITQPAAPITIKDSSKTFPGGFNTSCNGNSDGGIFITVTGGTPGYIISWSTGGTDDSITGLLAGPYSVTVVDNNGCVAILNDTLVAPPVFKDTVTSPIFPNGTTNLGCHGESNGSASAIPSGGVPPYMYLWSTGATDSTITGLKAGILYSVTVTDANGCSSTGSDTLTQPPTIVPLITSVPVGQTGTNILCHGDSTAAAFVSVQGGTFPFAYIWSSGATTDTALNLPAGTVFVTVTDANNCSADSFLVITQPTAISITDSSTTNVTCNGGSNGAIGLSVSGGTPSYLYLWSTPGADTTKNVSGLMAGIYTIMVTDANGCTATAQDTVSQPLAITLTSVVLTNVTCNNNANGSDSIAVAGGVPPYTFLWSTGQTTQTITGMVADSLYSVTVTDASLCTDTISFTLTGPTALVLSDSTINAHCFGFKNGAIYLTVMGGTPAYSFNWSDGETTAAITELFAGPYSVTVTDLNGCTDTASFNITQPSKLSIVDSISNVSCFGLSNGSITITSVIGGIPPYIYQWSLNDATSQSITGLTDTSYNVIVTDSIGCVAIDTFQITQPTVLALTITGTDTLTCHVVNDSINVSATGGTPPYSYLWTNNATTATVSGLAGDSTGITYSVTVTDMNGCQKTDSFTIVQLGAITANLSPLAVTGCSTDTTGSITSMVMGGLPPYAYMWSSPVEAYEDTSANPVNLPGGNYTVTVTDRAGCTTTASTTILAPLPVTVDTSNGKMQITCFGAMNGAIDLTSVVSGGSGFGTYTYMWSNDSTASMLSGLDTGHYTVTVTDLSGCTGVGTFIITEPAKLVITSLSGKDTVSCSGAIITVTAAGGTTGPGTYSYTWSNNINNNTPTDTIIGPVGSSTYTVVVTDFNGCTADTTFTIVQLNGLAVKLDSVDVTGCSNDSTGAVSVTPIGGIAPFTYSWSNGATDSSVVHLPEGNYSVTVTDINGCTGSGSITVNGPAPLQVSLTPLAVTGCSSDTTGSITTSVTGGVGPFTYMWGIPVEAYENTDSAVVNLPAGNYAVTVTDHNGCTTTGTTTILAPLPVTIDTSNGKTEVSCFGGNNGAIDLTSVVSGGSGFGSYSYIWSNDSTTITLTGLTAGSYTVTVTDLSGCSAIGTFVITQPTQLVITSLTGKDTVSCSGAIITVTAAGGTTGPGTYTYTWSNNINNNTPTDTIIGPVGSTTYTVVVTDFNGCTADTTFTIVQLNGLTAKLDSIDVTGCSNDSTGAVSVTPIGGVSPFTYSWSNGATDSSVVHLPKGNYSVTVTDINGCTGSGSITVNGPAPLQVSLTPLAVTGCSSDTTGSITTSVTGGVGPFTYMWGSPVEAYENTDSAVVNLPAASYSVTVTDHNGCTTTGSTTILAPLPVTIDTSNGKTEVSCFGGNNGAIDLTSVVSGGSGFPTYNYLWSNDSTTITLTGLTAGSYTVTVTDLSGCSAIGTFIITQPTQLVITSLTGKDTVGCLGAIITVTAAGGTTGPGTYTYTWTNNLGNNTPIDTIIGPVGSSTYTLTVTDFNGCTADSTFTIVQLSGLTVTLDTVGITGCGSNNNGVVSAVPSGGLPPFTYHWSNGATDSSIVSLPAGTYAVTVTDVNGCTGSDTTILHGPAPLSISLTPLAVTGCSSDTTGSITTSVTGGVGPFTYMWGIPVEAYENTDSAVVNLPAGNYAVTVTDKNGCTATGTTTILAPLAVTIDTSNGKTEVSCFGGNNGAIDLTSVVSGGSGFGTYNYIWSNDSTTITLTGLSAGTYIVTATDLSGCSAIGTFVITQPTQLVITSLTGMDTVGCKGAIKIITASGGTTGPGTYSYTWTNNLSNNTPIDTIVGSVGSTTYTVTVTDFNGCTVDTTFTIVQLSGLVVTLDSTDITHCNGDSTGAITTNVTGGALPFTYTWSNNATGQNLTGLVAGNYCVTVTDANGCTGMACTTINQPTAVTATLTETDVTCNGSSNGSVTFTGFSGGTPGYTWVWTGGDNSDTTITGLATGTYFITVFDSHGCTGTASTFVGTHPPVVVTAVSTNVTCNGLKNGTASAIDTSGGVHHYTFVWTPGGGTTDSISGLDTGTYTVVMTDANGCTASSSTTITEPPVLSILSLTGKDTLGCNAGGTATKTINGTGGTLPYSYNWSNGETTQTVTDLTGSPAPGTTYTVTITDAKNCTTKDTTFSIIQSPGLTVTINNDAVNKCHGDATASANAVVTGGTAPFTYSWSNNQTTDTATNLALNTYFVTVTDNGGCSGTASVSVTDPAAIVLTIDTVTNLTCGDSTDGHLRAVALGGSGTYSYNWHLPNDTLADLTGLSKGAYVVTVKDANGCSATAAANLTSVNITIHATVVQPSACNPTSGLITVTSVTGGSGNYSYAWSGSANTTNALSGLGIGNDTVTVTDNTGGCSVSQPFTLITTPSLNVAQHLTNPSCNGICDGKIVMTVTGGTPPYHYSWSDPRLASDTTDSATALCAGRYTFVVIDNSPSGCSQSVSVQLVDPPLPTFSAGGSANTCDTVAELNGSVSTAGYTGTWSKISGSGTIADPNSAVTSVSGLSSGTTKISWTVKNANGCTYSDTISLNVTPLKSEAGVLAPSCDSTNIVLAATPAVAPDSGTWSSPDPGVKFSDVHNPTASITSVVGRGNTILIWTVSNGNCSESDSVIYVRKTVAECTEDSLAMPTGISPNNDGYNDYFVIHGIERYPSNHLTIYNRWGDLVFDYSGYTNDPSTMWHGQNKSGNQLPDGTYFAILKATPLNGGTERDLKGYVDVRSYKK